MSCDLWGTSRPTCCLRMRDGIQEMSLGSASRGSTLIWRYLLSQNRKQCGFLTGWANKHNRQHKRRKGWGSQCLAAEETVEPSHPYNTVLGVLSSTTNEEIWLEPVPGNPPKIYSRNEKKDSDQPSSNPMLEDPVLGARCSWALMSSSWGQVQKAQHQQIQMPGVRLKR